MEIPKYDSLKKLPTMVMCGDQPSFTKTELNLKESKILEKRPSTFRVSPTVLVFYMMLLAEHYDKDMTSRTDKSQTALHVTSENALRIMEARRRIQSLDVMNGDTVNAPGNRALIQAALGSFHWPPYLLAVWVLVLLLTHMLHCLVNMLEKALPKLKNICLYFHSWVEETWKAEGEQHHRIYPILLALVTSLLYTLYYTLYAVYSVSTWAVEPLGAEFDERNPVTSPSPDLEEKCTNYAHVEDIKQIEDKSAL